MDLARGKRLSAGGAEVLGDAGGGASRAHHLAAASAYPKNFLATGVEACPISNPYEQRLAICGLSPDADAPKGVQTALYVASVNPLQGQGAAGGRKFAGAGAGAAGQSSGEYALRKVHDNLDGYEQLNVLKFAWHPRSANHLVVLLENPLTHECFLHLYNVAGAENQQAVGAGAGRGHESASASTTPMGRRFDAFDDGDSDDEAAFLASTTAGLVPEQKYALHASGQGLGYGMVKVERCHRFVDFAFGPSADGWGCFTLFLLAQSGQVYYLCPVIPFGASYDSEVVSRLHRGIVAEIQLEKEQLADGDAAGAPEEALDELFMVKAWLESVFPTLLRAQDEREEGASPGGHGGRTRSVGREVEPDRAALLQMTASLCGPVSQVRGGGDNGDEAAAELEAGAEGAPAKAAAAASIACVSAGSNCVVLLTGDSGGRVDAHVIMGDLQPQWDLRQPAEILPEGRAGPQVAASLNATGSSAIQTLLVDRVAFEIASGEDGEFRIEADPVEPQCVYCLHRRGIYMLCLSWIPSLSQWLSAVADGEGDSDGFSSGRLAGSELSMPPLVVHKLHWAEDIIDAEARDLVHGVLISNRVSGSTLAFGENNKKGDKGFGAALKFQKIPEDLPQGDAKPARPAVAFDPHKLECSTAELDEWYGKYVKEHKPAAIKPAGQLTSDAAFSEYLHSSLSQLKGEYIERFLSTKEDLSHRLEVVRKEAGAQASKQKSICETVDAMNDKVARNQAKLREVEARQADLTSKSTAVLALLERSMSELSSCEKDFREELEDMGEAVKLLERQLRSVQDRARRGLPHQLHQTQLSDYIRQLPKVRQILEEDAEIVRNNIAKVTVLMNSVNEV